MTRSSIYDDGLRLRGSAERRNPYFEYLLREGSNTTPIKSHSQGLSRLAFALLAGLEARDRSARHPSDAGVSGAASGRSAAMAAPFENGPVAEASPIMPDSPDAGQGGEAGGGVPYWPLQRRLPQTSGGFVDDGTEGLAEAMQGYADWQRGFVDRWTPRRLSKFRGY